MSLDQTLRSENGLSVVELVTNETGISDTTRSGGNKRRPQGNDSNSKQVPVLARYQNFREELSIQKLIIHLRVNFHQ
jgi:hypothetical protein